MHTHYYRGETSYEDGHRHNYSGMTSPAPDTPGHTHMISDRTSMNDRHTHRFSFSTGPAREYRGGHVHHYAGVAQFNDGHIHTMGGCTSVDED